MSVGNFFFRFFFGNLVKICRDLSILLIYFSLKSESFVPSISFSFSAFHTPEFSVLYYFLPSASFPPHPPVVETTDSLFKTFLVS